MTDTQHWQLSQAPQTPHIWGSIPGPGRVLKNTALDETRISWALLVLHFQAPNANPDAQCTYLLQGSLREGLLERVHSIASSLCMVVKFFPLFNSRFRPMCKRSLRKSKLSTGSKRGGDVGQSLESNAGGGLYLRYLW